MRNSVKEIFGLQKSRLWFVLAALLISSLTFAQAQNVLFVKSGVTDGDVITVGGVSGTVYNTCKAAMAASSIGDTVRLLEDIVETTQNISGITEGLENCCVMIDRRVLDGQGHSLTAAAYVNEVIFTKGGTIMNIVVNGAEGSYAYKGIFSWGYNGSASMNADLILDRVTLNRVLYTYHCDGDKYQNVSVLIKNSNINGWTSFSPVFKSYTVIDCAFGEGLGYAVFRPYGQVVVSRTSFSAGYQLDPTISPSILLNDCNLAGTPLTSYNIDNILVNLATDQPVPQEDPSSHAVVVDGDYSANDDGEITGGIYGGNLDVLNSMIASGHAAFPLNTDPQTYQVDPAYFIHFNAGGGTGGTMDDSYVPREAPNNVFTVPANTEFTYGSYAFLNWNSKPYGAGTNIAVGSTMTLSSDTTLYAEWNIDFVAKIGDNTYPTIQEAVDYANANLTGDVTIDLVKSTSEVVKILQKDGISIMLNGNDVTLTGQIFISNRQGDPYPVYSGTHTESNTITIDNLNFAYDGDYFHNYVSGEDAFIEFCKNCEFGNVLNYSHNITISNCDFDGNGSSNSFYGVSAINTVYNLVIDNCTVKNALGLAELQSVTNFTVSNCSAEDVVRGLWISGGGAGTFNIIDNGITATDYAVLLQNQPNSTTVNMSGNTMEAQDVFILQCNDNGLGTHISGASTSVINITSGTYIGNVVDKDVDTFGEETGLNISGGIYSEDVSGEPCEEGYAAFANGTTPETWTVTKAWFLRYNANGGTGTMDSVFVKQSDDAAGRTVTVADCNYTYDSYAFAEWNTKADGTGNRVAPGAQLTLTQDTVLYAQWARVKNVTQDKYYNTLQAAINDATAGDSLLVLTDISESNIIMVGKSIIINGGNHTLTSTANRGMRITNSNLDVSIRNLNIDCPSNIPQSDYRGISVDGDMSNINLLIDSCRITGARYGINMSQGSTNINATVTNSYIKAQASLNCYSNQSTFTFNNDTIYGINKWNGSGEDYGTIVIDGNNNSSYAYGNNNNINFTQSVIIAEKQGTALQHVFYLQKYASSNNIVVDCPTKIVDGPGISANNVSDRIYIYAGNCHHNTITLPLTDEQKISLASNQANRRFTLQDVDDAACATMTRVSHSAHNGRDGQNIDFHLYFNPDYANHVIAGTSKLTLIEDVILQSDITVDVNGRFQLGFKDFYNTSITHGIINNGHHIILAEGTSCGTDVEVPDSIFAVPAGFDGKIVHKSVTGQVHKFEYYAAPYVAINVNRDIKYLSLQTATDSVNTGDTVRLLRNITYTTTSDRVIITDKNLTLDLYGDTITTNFSGTTAGSYAAIQLKSGYLEIKDTKGEGVIRATNRGSAVLVGTSTSAGGNASFTLNSGKLEGAAASNTWGLYVVLNDGDSVVINGGEVAANESSTALYNKQGKVVVNDGRIQGNGKAVYNNYAYNNTYFPTTILNGGEIHGGNTSYPCVDNAGGTFIMNNGTITIAGTTGISSGTSYDRNGELYINGGVISDEGTASTTIYLTNGEAHVSGGTFTATGDNTTIFKGVGTGAVFTISDATLNAATMFNIGSGDNCVVNGGKFHNTGEVLLTNAGIVTLNGGIYTSEGTAHVANTGTLNVNKGWYCQNLTSSTRSTPKKYVAREGDGEINYKDETYLVPLPADSVTAAGLTGSYYQLGNIITYNSNDGGDSIIEQFKPIDEAVILLGDTTFPNVGRLILNWNTESNGSGTAYEPGSTLAASANADLLLYAIRKLAPCPSAVDYEGNRYDTMRVVGGGYHCWTTVNLRSKKYSDGRDIANWLDGATFFGVDVDRYGYFYDWYAVMDTFRNTVPNIEDSIAAGVSVQGICPTGWHLPTPAEVEELMAIYDPEQLMSDEAWISGNGTNTSGFNMLPGGFYNGELDRYERLYVSAYFWIMTPPTSVYHACEFGAACSTTELVAGKLMSGYSVRCVNN